MAYYGNNNGSNTNQNANAEKARAYVNNLSLDMDGFMRKDPSTRLYESNELHASRIAMCKELHGTEIMLYDANGNPVGKRSYWYNDPSAVAEAAAPKYQGVDMAALKAASQPTHATEVAEAAAAAVEAEIANTVAEQAAGEEA